MPPKSKTITGKDYSQYLEGYKEVNSTVLKNLNPGDKIRYLANNEFKKGGIIKIHKYPTYTVLINPVNKATWCVQLTEPSLKMWVRTKEIQNAEIEEMKKVYKMFKEGKLVAKR
jgi:hypothetical protein